MGNNLFFQRLKKKRKTKFWSHIYSFHDIRKHHNTHFNELNKGKLPTENRS